MLIPLLATALAFVAPLRAAENVESKQIAIAAIADSEWEKTARTDHLYSQSITPAFPASWPPNGDGRLAYITYSGGRSPGLSDGEHVGSAWGRIIVDPQSAKVSFERLSSATKMIGTQGIQPMTARQIAIYNAQGNAFDAMKTLAKSSGAPKAVDPVVRDYYCQWKRFDGVIAEKLPRPEKDFLRWLDCDQRNQTDHKD